MCVCQISVIRIIAIRSFISAHTGPHNVVLRYIVSLHWRCARKKKCCTWVFHQLMKWRCSCWTPAESVRHQCSVVCTSNDRTEKSSVKWGENLTKKMALYHWHTVVLEVLAIIKSVEWIKSHLQWCERLIMTAKQWTTRLYLHLQEWALDCRVLSLDIVDCHQHHHHQVAIT